MSSFAVFAKLTSLSLCVAASCLLATPAYAAAETPAPAQLVRRAAKGKHVAQGEGNRRDKKHKKQASQDTAPAMSTAEVAPAPFAQQESSTHARDIKPLSLLVDSGLVNLVNAGAGGELNYAVTPHEVLGVSILHAQFAWFGFKSTYDFYTANSRTFFGNSFYLLLGGGVRRTAFTTSYYSDPTAGSGTAPATGIVGQSDVNAFSAMHAVGEVGLGNRWQFGPGITIGCDWLIYDQPLTQLSSSAQYGSAAQTDQQKDDTLKDFKQATANGTVTITRFQIGWAF